MFGSHSPEATTSIIVACVSHPCLRGHGFQITTSRQRPRVISRTRRPQHETCCMLRQLVTPHLPAHPNHPDISLCSSHIGAGTFYRPDAGGDHLALGSILIGATRRRTSCQPAGLVPSRTHSANVNLKLITAEFVQLGELSLLSSVVLSH